MRLHVMAKNLAFGGVMSAFAVLLIFMGSVFESSTLFLLVLASFLMGMVELRCDLKMSLLTTIVTVVLCLLLSPNKWYCATFTCLSFYIVVVECIYKKRQQGATISKVREWLVKAVIFHVVLISAFAIVLWMGGISLKHTSLAMLEKGNGIYLAYFLIVVAAEAFWIVFDRAYFYVQRQYGHYFMNGI